METIYQANAEAGIDATTYERISEDRDANKVGDQRADNLRVCQSRGYRVVADCLDDSIPATRSKATGKLHDRPGWNRLLELVATHPNALVIVWPRTDRAMRDEEDLMAFRKACRAAKRAGLVRLVEDHSGARGDPLDPQIKLIMGVVVATAGYEVDIKDARSTAAIAHRAAEGAHHGGGRSWGHRYEHEVAIMDPANPAMPKMVKARTKAGVTMAPEVKRWGRLVIVAEEAAIIRDVAARLIAGESLASVVRSLQLAGASTVKGHRWTASQLAQAIQAPRLAGIRMHHGTPYPAKAWEPILTAEQHQALVALFAGRKGQPRASVSRFLLSGFARCGRCGHWLQSTPTHGRRCYGCPPRSQGGCGGLSVEMVHADEAARALLLAEVDRPGFALALEAAMALQEGSADALRALRATKAEKVAILAGLEDQAVAGLIKADRFARMASTLEDAIATLDAEAARMASASKPSAAWALAGSGESLARAWNGATVAERREMLGLVFHGLIIHPAGRQGAKGRAAGGVLFQSERVKADPIY